MTKVKEMYVMVESSAEEKTAACQAAADAILAYVREHKHEGALLESLVLASVSMISVEAYTRDQCSNQARNEIYKDAVDMLSTITGFQVELIDMDERSVN